MEYRWIKLLQTLFQLAIILTIAYSIFVISHFDGMSETQNRSPGKWKRVIANAQSTQSKELILSCKVILKIITYVCFTMLRSLDTEATIIYYNAKHCMLQLSNN